MEIEPCPPFIDAFARALAEGYETNELNDQDELPVLVLTTPFDGQSFRSGIPIAAQKATLPLLAAIGGMRGHRSSTDLTWTTRPIPAGGQIAQLSASAGRMCILPAVGGSFAHSPAGTSRVCS